MRHLRIYFADDHTLFRQALTKSIVNFKGVAEVKEASNELELLDMIQLNAPDVVILDLDMPVLDGRKTCERLNKEFPEVKIMIVSMHDGPLEIYRLLNSGAHAFLSKNSEMEEFEAAIYSIVDKGRYRNEIMRSAIRFGTSKGKKFNIKLTPRELFIVQLICKGFTSKEISEKLTLSGNTVRNHRQNIMRKLLVKNATELVKYAVDNGL